MSRLFDIQAGTLLQRITGLTELGRELIGPEGLSWHGWAKRAINLGQMNS